MSRILVADDDVQILRLLEAALSQRGYEVLTCAGGESALEIASLHQPDLIVLDVEMPRLDGYQVLWHLNNKADTQHIPTLVLSSRNSDRDVDYGKRLGAREYMFKPFSIDELLGRMDTLLQGGAAVKKRLN